MESFDCGKKELNDFLCSDEVTNYERLLLGKTTLVYYQGELASYHTLFNKTLRIRYLKTYKSFSKLGEYHLDGIPATAIGRLAVDKRWQNRGIGRTAFKKISMDAYNNAQHSAIRLIVVQAKEEAIDFYAKLGFEHVFETRSEKKLFQNTRTRTMFFDLTALDSV